MRFYGSDVDDDDFADLLCGFFKADMQTFAILQHFPAQHSHVREMEAGRVERKTSIGDER